jgi:hypothetical protein
LCWFYPEFAWLVSKCWFHVLSVVLIPMESDTPLAVQCFTRLMFCSDLIVTASAKSSQFHPHILFYFVILLSVGWWTCEVM